MQRNETPEPPLTARQARVLALLAGGATQEAAAREAGAGRATVARWLASPRFRSALRAASEQALQDALLDLQRTARDAVGVLAEVMQDRELPPAVRVTAARVALDTALRATEQLDLAVRVAALERAAEGEDR